MKQKKYTKRALCMSLLSMLLCCSMLIGTTFAWFTDSVTSGRNKIVAGNLDVELYHSNKTVTTEEKVTTSTELFEDVDLWEPGVIAYENFTVKNVGTLALKYELTLSVYGENATTAGNSLSEVIKVAFIEGAFDPATGRDGAQGQTYGELTDTVKSGTIEPKGTDAKFAVILYWEPGAEDDLYNLKNGLTTTDKEPLWIDLGVNLHATQTPHESDSFDNQYDADAGYVYTAVSPEELGPVAKNAKKGDVIQLTGDEFDAEALNSIPDGVALQGEVDADGNPLTTVEVHGTSVNLKNNSISNVKFVRGTGEREGKDLLDIGDASGETSFSIENCIFDYSDYSTGTLRFSFPGLNLNGPGTVKGCQFKGNKAINIDRAVGEILIEDCIFDNNGDNTSINCHSNPSPDSHITIKGCQFTKSGQMIEMYCPTVTMEGCTLNGTSISIRQPNSTWTTHDNTFMGDYNMYFEFMVDNVTFTSTNDTFASKLANGPANLYGGGKLYLFTISTHRTGINITIDGNAPDTKWVTPES